VRDVKADATLSRGRLRVRGVMAYLKLALIPVVAVLWLLGLADQLHDLTQTAKYVGISLLMIAFATI
jgi:hypothetical protein